MPVPHDLQHVERLDEVVAAAAPSRPVGAVDYAYGELVVILNIFKQFSLILIFHQSFVSTVSYLTRGEDKVKG